MGITINTRIIATVIIPPIIGMATAIVDIAAKGMAAMGIATAGTDTGRVVPAMAVTAAGRDMVDTNTNQNPDINQNPGTNARKSLRCKSKQDF
jgi:hypothetical protein